MASANMVSAASVNKVALGQGAAASGSTLGKSTFTGACLPVSYNRVSRRTEGKVCMSASKDEGKKVGVNASAPECSECMLSGYNVATLTSSAAETHCRMFALLLSSNSNCVMTTRRASVD